MTKGSAGQKVGTPLFPPKSLVRILSVPARTDAPSGRFQGVRFETAAACTFETAHRCSHRDTKVSGAARTTTPTSSTALAWLTTGLCNPLPIMPYVAIPPSTRNTTYTYRPGLRETAEWDWLSEPMRSYKARIR